MRAAEAPELRLDEGRVSLILPRAGPLTLDEMPSPRFDHDEAVERIRKAASTGWGDAA